MNYIKKMFSAIVVTPGFKTGRKISLEKLWRVELVVAGILLLLMLSFNVWVYQTFVSGISDAVLPEETEGFVFLDKENLNKASEIVDSYQIFLRKPYYPALINDPF